MKHTLLNVLVEACKERAEQMMHENAQENEYRLSEVIKASCRH
jgi:pheromone shutdown protein TraB